MKRDAAVCCRTSIITSSSSGVVPARRVTASRRFQHTARCHTRHPLQALRLACLREASQASSSAASSACFAAAALECGHWTRGASAKTSGRRRAQVGVAKTTSRFICKYLSCFRFDARRAMSLFGPYAEAPASPVHQFPVFAHHADDAPPHVPHHVPHAHHAHHAPPMPHNLMAQFDAVAPPPPVVAPSTPTKVSERRRPAR